MRITPYPAPTQSELDKVKRVLFPASDDEEEEVFHSLPLTDDATAKSDGGEEEEEETMGRQSGKDDLKKKKKDRPTKVGGEFNFKLDPDVETFRNKPTTPGEAKGASSILSPSPSRNRFDPPFKTPPSSSSALKLSSAGATLEEKETAANGGSDEENKGKKTKNGTSDHLHMSASSSLHDAEDEDAEKTLVLPAIADDLQSSSAKVDECVEIDVDSKPLRFSTPLSQTSANVDLEKTPKSKTLPESPSQVPPTTPGSKGKRRLFTNKREQIDVLPSPEKKKVPYTSKMPKIKLKDSTKQLNGSKQAKPKKPKRETAKDRAEAYRQSNRDKILRDMQKQRSSIQDLLERRRQRRCEREPQLPQDSQSPERDRTG